MPINMQSTKMQSFLFIKREMDTQTIVKSLYVVIFFPGYVFIHQYHICTRYCVLFLKYAVPRINIKHSQYICSFASIHTLKTTNLVIVYVSNHIGHTEYYKTCDIYQTNLFPFFHYCMYMYDVLAGIISGEMRINKWHVMSIHVTSYKVSIIME